MWRQTALAGLAVVMQVLCAAAPAHAQNGGIDCNAFIKNPDGSWTVIRKVFIPVQNVRVVKGTVFRPGGTFLGDDMAARLDRACPNQQVAMPAPAETTGASQPPRVSLSQFADANGRIDVRELTCAQLADTSSEEAQLFLAWYSGWYHGLAKKPGINLARMRYLSQNIIAYCAVNRGLKLTEVMELWLK